MTDRIARVTTAFDALSTAIRRPPPPAAVILGYHDIVAAGHGDTDPLTVTSAELDRHLRILRYRGYRLVSLPRLVDAVTGGEDLAGMAAVTFDDALVGVHREALPVLAEHRVSATIFVTSDHRGVAPPWWPGMQRTMTEAELTDVVSAGHDLGSHTISHRSLVALSPDELAAELTGSRTALELLSGSPIDLLAYPFGHHDRLVRQAAADAGYRAACTFLNGCVATPIDPMMLPRFTMGGHSGRLRFAYHLARHPTSWPDHQLDSVGSAVDAGPG